MRYGFCDQYSSKHQSVAPRVPNFCIGDYKCPEYCNTKQVHIDITAMVCIGALRDDGNEHLHLIINFKLSYKVITNFNDLMQFCTKP